MAEKTLLLVMRVKVVAELLDPEDGEAGIIEAYSGRVLARFRSLRSAAATLRHWRPKYETDARVAAVGNPRNAC